MALPVRRWVYMNDYISVKEEAETVNVLESIHEIEEKLHPEEAMTNVLMSFFIILVSFLFTVPVSFFEVYASSISHEPFERIFLLCKTFIFMQIERYTPSKEYKYFLYLKTPVIILLF